MIRTNRAATELVPLEGPARKAGPLTAPDVEIADKTALPDEPNVRPELKQTGEQAPVRVEAAVPLKIDDPTAESRPEVRIPFATLVPTSRGDRLDGPPLDLTKVEEIGVLIGDAREGPFVLVVDWVKVE